MFNAHFSTNRQLWTVEQLVEFAQEIGLDPDEARVSSSRVDTGHQVEEEQRAQRLGAHGTPFIVIDGKYGIGGGVDTATLVNAIEQVRAESQSQLLSMPFGAGDRCEPGVVCGT